MKNFIFILCVLTTISHNIYAQQTIDQDTTGVAKVGQPCPDFFFQKTINYKKPQTYLHDLKGKWVALDLWDMNCSGCIASLPHVSARQTKWGNSIQFVMATYDDLEGKNAKIYNVVNKKIKLAMPCFFSGTSDTASTDLFSQVKAGGLPFIIVIDPEGIVRAVTSHLDDNDLKQLLQGKSPKLLSAMFRNQEQRINKSYLFDTNVYLKIDGNGGKSDDFLFRSLLGNHDPKYHTGVVIQFKDDPYYSFKVGRIDLSGMSLTDIYRMAYWGGYSRYVFPADNRDTSGAMFWTDPVLELKDTSQFSGDYNHPYDGHLFDYSLIVPINDATKANMMKTMQHELSSFFKYYVTFETRQMPYYKLVIINPVLAKKIRSKGGVESYEDIVHLTSVKMTNYPMRKFAERFSNLKDAPFVDETGINYNIDLTFTAPYSDFDGNNEALSKIGLKVIKSEMPMKVLVIRDPKPDSTAVN